MYDHFIKYGTIQIHSMYIISRIGQNETTVNSGYPNIGEHAIHSKLVSIFEG